MEIKVDCSGFLDGEYLPAERKIDVLELVSLSGVKIEGLGKTGLKCTALAGCINETDVTVYPLNLPWLLDLVLVGTPSLYYLVFLPGTVGGSQPGWEVTCLMLPIGEVTDECLNVEGKELRAHLENMAGPPVDLLASFNREELEKKNGQQNVRWAAKKRV